MLHTVVGHAVVSLKKKLFTNGLKLFTASVLGPTAPRKPHHARPSVSQKTVKIRNRALRNAEPKSARGTKRILWPRYFAEEIENSVGKVRCQLVRQWHFGKRRGFQRGNEKFCRCRNPGRRRVCTVSRFRVFNFKIQVEKGASREARRGRAVIEKIENIVGAKGGQGRGWSEV